ncbi:hypothetical protein BDR07DRAFT_1384343 [Suillus spraguei]|nr:hypothetical protein BDR07DRAFT_1384343 [Suillus spraguei]
MTKKQRREQKRSRELWRKHCMAVTMMTSLNQTPTIPVTMMKLTLSNLPACLLAIKVTKDDMLTLISADPCEFAKDKLAEYIKSIPDDCSTKGDISIIVNSTGEIEKLLKHVIRAQDKILNLCGISPEWHAADTVSRFLKTTATYLEDI